MTKTPQKLFASLSISLSMMLFGAWLAMCAGAGQMFAQQVRYSSAHLNAERPVEQSLAGGPSELMAKMQTQRSAIAVVVADFDRDGTVDLVTGYAVAGGGALTFQRGNLAATSPTGADFDNYLKGTLVAPFQAAATVVELPVRPDFLQAVDLNGDGSPDVVVAQRGDSTAYVLLGNGKGGFDTAKAYALGGAVSALATWRSQTAANNLVAGVCGESGCSLKVIGEDGAVKSSFALPGTPTSVVAAKFNMNWTDDLAVVAGGAVLLYDGADAQLGKATVETLPLLNVAAITPGMFVWDGRGYLQMAALDASGTVHVLMRQGSTAGFAYTGPSRGGRGAAASRAAAVKSAAVKPAGISWTEPETLTQVAPSGDADAATFLVRGRFSGGGLDDLAVARAGKYAQVSHGTFVENAQRKTAASVTMDSTSAAVTSVATARLTPDVRLSTITADGRPQPAITIPSSVYHTYYVTNTNDGAANAANCPTGNSSQTTCRLRDAMAAASADAAAGHTNITTPTIDTVNIPAGTYKVSYNTGGIDANGSLQEVINVDASVNIVGAGAATTLLTGSNGPSLTSGHPTSADKVFSFDSGDQAAGSTQSGASYAGCNYTPYDIYVSAVTIGYGNNNNSLETNAVANDQGGNFDWTPEGTGTFYMNNSVVTYGYNAVGPGGGVGSLAGYNCNANGGNGADVASNNSIFEFDNTTFSNNYAVDVNNVLAESRAGDGGAIFLDYYMPLNLTNDTISSNTGQQGGALNYTAGGTGAGGTDEGACGSTAPFNDCLYIGGTTFSGNSAVYSVSQRPDIYGGAIYENLPLTITGTTFSGNTASTGAGGAIYAELSSTGATITDSTFTGNTATGTTNAFGGSAIFVEQDAASGDTLTLSYSRLHGNTASATTADTYAIYLDNTGSGSQPISLTATNNWWGCNPTTATNATATTYGTATALIAGTGCDTVYAQGADITFSGSPFTKLTLGVSPTSVGVGSSVTATGSLGQNSSGTVYTAANDTAYLATPITTFTLSNTGTNSYSPSATAFSSTAATGTSYAAATDTAPASTTGTGTATLTVDGQTVTMTYTVTAGPAATLTVSGFPSVTTAGTAGSVTVTAKDAGGNTATSYTGTVHFTSSDSQSVLPANYTFVAGDNGAHTFTSGAALKTAGTQSITATDTVTNSITGSETGITVTAGATASFTVTGPGPFTAPGIAGTATVTAKDAYGNTVGGSGFTGTVTLTSSDALAVFSPTSYTYTAADSGVHNFTVTLNTASLPVSTTSVTATSGAITGSETGIFVGDAIWVVNKAATEARLTNAGVQTGTAGTSNGSSTLGFVSFDNSGNVWVVENANSTVQVFSKAGVALITTTSGSGGVNTPVGIAIDGVGNAWVANGNNTVSEFSSAETAVSPATGYQSGAGTLSGVKGIAIDNAGAVWVLSGTGNAVTKVLGGAAPSPVPLVSGSNSATLGARP